MANIEYYDIQYAPDRTKSRLFSYINVKNRYKLSQFPDFLGLRAQPKLWWWSFFHVRVDYQYDNNGSDNHS